MLLRFFNGESRFDASRSAGQWAQWGHLQRRGPAGGHIARGQQSWSSHPGIVGNRLPEPGQSQGPHCGWVFPFSQGPGVQVTEAGVGTVG